MSISRLYWAIGSLFKTMPKFHYAVRTGRGVGVYESWEDCKAQVQGYKGARYKKFGTAEEAWDFVNTETNPSSLNSKSSQPSEQSNKDQSCSSSSSRRATQHKSYAPASLGSDYQCTPEPVPVFTPEYTHPMAYTNKRKHETTVDIDESRSNPYKKIRSYNISSRSSTSTSSSEKAAGSGQAVAYTDGSCESNGRRGARAGVGVYWGDDNPYNTSERLEGKQTNQRAEVTAAIRALQTAKSRSIKGLTLYTDSKYTMNAMNDWVHRWKVNGWKTVGNKDVLNKEDLQSLDRLCQEVNVDWKYVPGHANIKGNEAADSLAKAGARMPSL